MDIALGNPLKQKYQRKKQHTYLKARAFGGNVIILIQVLFYILSGAQPTY